MNALPVVYSRTSAIGSLLIRAAQWWAPWSHAAIVDGDGVIEARAGHGVVRTPMADFLARCSAVEHVQIACPDAAAALTFARSQIGKGYDYLAYIGFIARTDDEDRTRWECCELVEAALLAGGRQRFRVRPSRITPQQSFMVI
jgi:uncharacterized protein YycO